MKQSFKHFLLKYKYLISIIVFAVLISFVGEHSLVQRYSQRKEIAELKEKINEQKQIYENDKTKLDNIKNNPEAVKRVAHEKYYMKTEDEDIFVVKEAE